MAGSQLVDDELWELVKPLLPDHSSQRTGRPRVSDRRAFTAIVFVLVSGVPWRMVPRQIGESPWWPPLRLPRFGRRTSPASCGLPSRRPVHRRGLPLS